MFVLRIHCFAHLQLRIMILHKLIFHYTHVISLLPPPASNLTVILIVYTAYSLNNINTPQVIGKTLFCD